MDDGGTVGIVTVTYNSAALIPDFMASLLHQTHKDFVLYVIDNASSDDTTLMLGSYADSRVRIIRSRENVGVAEGNNIGIRLALRDRCSTVLLINNDTIFEPQLIAELVDGLARYECDMVVPKILFFDEPERIWSAGGYFSGFRGSARHYGFGQKDDGRFDLPRGVDYNPTCCMLIKRKVFDRVGLMDPKYFVYFDDTDFCWRARESGVRLFYLPRARLFHKVNSLTGGESEFTFRFSTRNHVYYILKNYPWWSPFYYFPVYQAHLFLTYLLLKRRPHAFWVAQKAFWEGVSLFNSLEYTLNRPKHPRCDEAQQ